MLNRCLSGVAHCTGIYIPLFRLGRLSTFISYICFDCSRGGRVEPFCERITNDGTFWFVVFNSICCVSQHGLFFERANDVKHHFVVGGGRLDTGGVTHVICLVSGFSDVKPIIIR